MLQATAASGWVTAWKSCACANLVYVELILQTWAPVIVCAGIMVRSKPHCRICVSCCSCLAAAPWWSWIGGALGAYYVIIVIIFAQKLGAGTLVAIFVCAQLITSIVLDLTGLVGFSRRVFSWQRWVGAASMVAGVVLVTYFPGETVAAVQERMQQAKQDSSSHTRHLTMELGRVAEIAPAGAAGVDATARVLADSAVELQGRSRAADLLVQLGDKV